MSEADGRVEPSGAATKSASVRFDEAVAAADAEPKQRRRRRRKARGGRPSKPLPEYFLADHPRREWFFHLSEIQLRLPADALLGQLEGGHVAKERRRGGVTHNKRARRPVPPDAPPPSSKAPAQARSTRPPGVEAMLAHAMAAPPPESESGDVFTESSADEDESQGVSALSLRLSDPQRSLEPESRIDPIACPNKGAEAPYDCRHERAAHAAMRQLGCASPPRPHPTARDARSAAERRLADKVQAEWTGFKAQVAPVHTPRLGPPSGLGSPTSVNAVAAGGELTESTFGRVSLELAAARLASLREGIDRDIVERNKMVPSAERRRELARLASARSRALHLSAARRAADRRDAVMSRRIEDVERWENVRRARSHEARLAFWLGVVGIAARAQVFRSQPRADAKMRAYVAAARVLQRRARRFVVARVERRFREACKGKFQSAVARLKQRRVESREAASALIQLFLRDFKLSSDGISRAILHFRYKVTYCQRLAKAWIACLRTRRACLGLMLTSIERQLLDAAEIADGFGVAAAGGATAARPHQKGARHLALFGSVIPPAERERIVNTLLSKVKRDYFGVLQRRAERRRDAENAVFRVDMTSIKAMLHEVGPPDGPPPRISHRRLSRPVRARGTALASEAPIPYFAVFSALRKPMTKMVKAAYRAHREQRMLKGAEQDRRLVVQVDGILDQPVSRREAARIPEIVDRIEAMHGYIAVASARFAPGLRSDAG